MSLPNITPPDKRQLKDHKCRFCGATGNHETLTEREHLIAFISGIKTNETIGVILTPQGLGRLVGKFRQLYTPNISVKETEEIIHVISDFKDKILDEMDQAPAMLERLHDSTFEMAKQYGIEYMANNLQCDCSCHPNMPYCDNCMVGEATGIWHIGKKVKDAIYLNAEKLGLKDHLRSSN